MEKSMQEQIKQFRSLQPAKNISWRVGAVKADKSTGQAVPYLKPSVIEDLMDDVVGAANWSNRFYAMEIGSHTSVVCEISVFINGQWVTKSDSSQVDSSTVSCLGTEVAIRLAFADALTRAAVMWGIGRYLARAPEWVPLVAGKFVSRPTLASQLLCGTERDGDEVSKPSKVEPVSEPKQVQTPLPVVAVVKQAVAPVASVTAAPAPAPAPAAERITKSVLLPDEETESRGRSAAAVDAALEASDLSEAVAVLPVAKHEPASSLPLGLPEGLNDEQLKTVKGLIEKMKKKLPTAMLRNYVRGPKAAEALPQAARDYVLALLDEADSLKAASELATQA